MHYISVNLKDEQEAKQKLYFDKWGTRELELLKPGDTVWIQDPTKKRGSGTSIVKTEVVPHTFMVLTSSSTLLWQNCKDLLKIWKMDVSEESSWTSPPQNSEEEQSPLSDSEPEQGPILPTENQRNWEMHLGSTEQRQCRTLAIICLDSETTTKNEPINRKLNSLFFLIALIKNPVFITWKIHFRVS